LSEIGPEDLRPLVDPQSFRFETTASLEPYVGLIGQERAVSAIRFGLSMESPGFNIVASGEPGTGRETAIREYLQAVSLLKPSADEWCYVNNFQDPYRPKALRLPAGRGVVFASAMATMIAQAKTQIPAIFADEDVVRRREDIVGSVQRRYQETFLQLAEQARQGGFLLQGQPGGFFLVPLNEEGQPMDDQAFSALEPGKRDELMQRREALMQELRGVMKSEQGVEVEANARLADLRRSVAETVVAALTDRLVSEYADLPEVAQYLSEVRREMIENIDDFIPRPEPPAAPAVPVPPPARAALSPLRRFEVNLLVDCTLEECSPVVFETNPTPQRMFGRIEKEAVFGAVTTDFTMIRPGSMHRANGGYLVFDFEDLLLYPVTWVELKRTLSTGELHIEELGEKLGFIETKTIRPQPIPWTGKVVALARESIYRALYTQDPDFRDLFKVKADFDLNIDRTPDNERAYAGLIASVTQKEGLLPLNPGAVARVVEEGMRFSEDHNKLSIRFGDICDIVREASYWAEQAGLQVVSVEHVRKAIWEREHRVDLAEEHLQEALEKGIILIETEGAAAGQVNGLSVIDLGDMAFGQASKITATVGVGREGIVDLQREARMSGPIHSKAVLTLTGFLNDRYAEETPLTLNARVSFEQSYGMIEGDSATVAETCALLSRLADVPVKQSLAITGSMNQRGEVQAIGGANYKIEGFYDVCQQRGLTGQQGVIIPASNVQHLMLREDVVQAVREGKFHVYGVESVDEALELLTGRPAGAKGADGTYPAGSINALVQEKLRHFAERWRASTEWRVREAVEEIKAPEGDS
jgi:lon-related putative ATP-dependent protease